MDHRVRNKLAVMMFLEFFIWGAWLPLLTGYLAELKLNGLQIAWIMNAFALASFTAMFFSTQFADRNFAAEKFMAFSHLIGGLAILGLFFVREGWTYEFDVGGSTRYIDLTFAAFFALMLLHSLFYVPTISIANSIAFANLKDAQRDFGLVRLWGTIGWIAASWPMFFMLIDWAKLPKLDSVPLWDWLETMLKTSKSPEHGELHEAKAYIFVASGVASLLLSAFSLVLPHTPPKPAQPGGEKFAWLEAMSLLRHPFILVLFIVTFIDAAVLSAYFFYASPYFEHIKIPAHWIMTVMSIGQVAEIGTMAVLGYFLKSLGWRTTMILGVLGHTVRFGLFALLPDPWIAIVVNMLHGVCYAFFFATVYIFVDEFFPKDARSSAQGLFNFLILGLGPFVGNFVWGELQNAFTHEVAAPNNEVIKVVDYSQMFFVPAGIALFAAMMLALFFWPPRKAVPEPSPASLPDHLKEAIVPDKRVT